MKTSTIASLLLGLAALVYINLAPSSEPVGHLTKAGLTLFIAAFWGYCIARFFRQKMTEETPADIKLKAWREAERVRESESFQRTLDAEKAAAKFNETLQWLHRRILPGVLRLKIEISSGVEITPYIVRVLRLHAIECSQQGLTITDKGGLQHAYGGALHIFAMGLKGKSVRFYAEGVPEEVMSRFSSDTLCPLAQMPPARLPVNIHYAPQILH